MAKRPRRVTGAIRFDDEPRLLAEEVDDEGPEWVLSAKLRAYELTPAEASPQLVLCRCLATTQLACAIGERSKQARH